MNNKTLKVALVKEACRICAKLIDGPIILNTRLTEAEAKKVEDLHGKTIGFAPEPCTECKEFMKQGIIIVTIDESKSDDKDNPYRTGGFFVVIDEAIKRLPMEPELLENILKKRVCFMEHAVALRLGLFDAP